MEITRGPKKHTLLLYYGETQNLKWDPAKYTWPTQVPPHDFHKGANQPLQGQNPQQATPVSFLIYTATMGCELVKRRHMIPNPITRKWGGLLVYMHRL
jgi:hypothetical protein